MNKGQFPFLANPPNNRVLLKSFTGAAASAAFSDVGRSPWQGTFLSGAASQRPGAFRQISLQPFRFLARLYQRSD
jgi:hypothetical protein